MSPDTGWYWCLAHQTVEHREGCRAATRLGPYSTPEEARAWKERVDARNDRWDREDERWRNRPPVR